MGTCRFQVGSQEEEQKLSCPQPALEKYRRHPWFSPKSDLLNGGKYRHLLRDREHAGGKHTWLDVLGGTEIICIVHSTAGL